MWTCLACSTANDEAHGSCAVCGGVRSHPAPAVPVVTVIPPSPSGPQWPVIPPEVPATAPMSPGAVRSPRSMAMIVALVIGGLALAGIGAFIGLRLGHDPERVDTRAGADAPAIDRTGGDAVGDDSAALDIRPLVTIGTAEGSATPNVDSSSAPVPTVPPTTSPPVVTPGQQLGLIRDADRNQVEGLVDTWVPQVSSKRVGLTDKISGITYDDQSILAYHQNLVSQYGALLLWSGDYSTFKSGDLWVSVAPVAYSSKDEAKAWCDRAGIDANNCFAKLLSHTHGTADSTGLR